MNPTGVVVSISSELTPVAVAAAVAAPDAVATPAAATAVRRTQRNAMHHTATRCNETQRNAKQAVTDDQKHQNLAFHQKRSVLHVLTTANDT